MDSQYIAAAVLLFVIVNQVAAFIRSRTEKNLAPDSNSSAPDNSTKESERPIFLYVTDYDPGSESRSGDSGNLFSRSLDSILFLVSFYYIFF